MRPWTLTRACLRGLLPLLAAGAALGQEAAEKPVPPDDPQQGIEALRPAYRAPEAFEGEWSRDGHPPLRLVGLDLLQEDRPIAETRLRPSAPLTVVCYWLPQRTLRTGLTVELRFWSSGGLLTRAVERPIAIPNDAPWRPGSIYKQSYTVEMADIARDISGKALLVASVLAPVRTGPRAFPLQRVDLYMEPALGRGRVSPAALENAFGPRARPLSVAFRLGREAEAEVPVPPEARSAVAAIGVASAFSYGSVPEGEPVCDVVATDDQGRTYTWTLRSGTDTARADYDFNPASMNHTKAVVVQSWDADYLDIRDRPFQRHAYRARLEVPSSLGPVAGLTIRARCPAVFEVYGMVLVPPNEP